MWLENLIRGLDDDEVNFLDIVDKAKMDAEKRQQIEENNELLEFRQRVASLQEKSIDQVRQNAYIIENVQSSSFKNECASICIRVFLFALAENKY